MDQNKIRLTPMTEEMYHEYFREYENDPDLYLDEDEYVPYVYSKEKVEQYIQRQSKLNRISLAIMCDDEMVGNIVIKDIREYECATMSISLRNSGYKDQGIGTEAERQAVEYVFYEMDIPVLYADTIKTNMRSQHVLEKVGFVFVREDDEFRYYEIKRG